MDKVLQLCQKNTAKLDQIVKRQDKFEEILSNQKESIDKILITFEEHKEVETGKKGGKDKGKTNKFDFYQVNMCMLYY